MIDNTVSSTSLSLTRAQRRKQRTNVRLRDAAQHLIRQRSYEALTVQDIIQMADVARGTFYVHFTDKEDLVWTLLRERLDRLDAVLMALVRDEPRSRRPYLVLLAIFEFAGQHRDLVSVAVGPNSHPAFTERVHSYFTQVIDTTISSELDRPGLAFPPGFLGEFVAGALLRTLNWWFSHDTASDYGPAEVALMVYRMVFREAP